MTDFRTYRTICKRITNLYKEIDELKEKESPESLRRLNMVKSTLDDNLKVFAILFNRIFDRSIDYQDDADNIQ